MFKIFFTVAFFAREFLGYGCFPIFANFTVTVFHLMPLLLWIFAEVAFNFGYENNYSQSAGQERAPFR
jgi:hypothetical protein